ncbi:DUF3833 domain-containing protein [Burkholderiaceae bacterium FT117]|uniref:DUF3833 domain-containing protein n=1 Tax=Zeimonas sediminis TaxID=2944268 RepID=UPI002342C7B2|nr:DUF3833 domain-containing protein [Zeimonas sediminis]MCM5570961.1 DUF3833 domain-containing protein [Zeimonas sediminis]
MPARRRLLGAAAGAATLAATGPLAGCASIEPARYAGERPALDLQRYFDGIVDAWGVFQDRSGEVVRRFTVVIRCSWDGDVGTLDEDFTYSDGSTQKRVWTLRKLGDAPLGDGSDGAARSGDPARAGARPAGRVVHWAGTAADVVGEARGSVAGNAFNWRYTMALEVDGRTWHVDFDDWMYLVDERTMLNRAVMSKFGIRLGEVLLSFRKR